MDKKQAQQLTDDVLIADLLIRLKALETLLISKNFFTEEQLKEQTKHIAKEISLSILQKSNVSGDLNKIIQDLK